MYTHAHREKVDVSVDHDVEKKYLKLDELGCVLRQLNITLHGKYDVLVYGSCSTVWISHSCQPNKTATKKKIP